MQESPTKVVTIHQTPTHTILRWVEENQIMRFAGKLPEAWLALLRKDYTIQQAS